MSARSVLMEALRAHLAALYPARVVTRDLRDFADREPSELKRGIYTLVAQSEAGYPNYRGREADLGTLSIMLIAQILRPDNAAPSSIEDAEFEFVDEVQAACRALPATLGNLLLTEWSNSRQLEAPYGWVLFSLEIQS